VGTWLAVPLWSRVRVDVLRFRKPPAQSVQRQIKTTEVTAIEHIEAGPFFALVVLNHRSTRGAAPKHPSIIVGGVNRIGALERLRFTEYRTVARYFRRGSGGRSQRGRIRKEGQRVTAFA
jgi:hypothetical protein